jgi:hypothetical protein
VAYRPVLDLCAIEALLAQFSDEEIASGVVASDATSPDERYSVEALVEQLNEARRQSPQE